MKCPRCHGTGKITEWVATDTVSEYEFPCRKCNGTGEIEVTNDEWFDTLSTEEKAKFLDSNGMRYCVCGCKECIISEQCKSGGIRKTHEEMWVEWLKAEHKE